MRLIRQKCFAGDSAFYTQCPDGAGPCADNITTKNGKNLGSYRENSREIDPAFKHAMGDRPSCA